MRGWAAIRAYVTLALAIAATCIGFAAFAAVALHAPLRPLVLATGAGGLVMFGLLAAVIR